MGFHGFSNPSGWATEGINQQGLPGHLDDFTDQTNSANRIVFILAMIEYQEQKYHDI
jgi:hypothetical protein